MKLFEVFESLRVDKSLRAAFEATEVIKVTSSKHSDRMDVFISSDSFIARQLIMQMEGILFSQIFSPAGKDVSLHVHYSFADDTDFGTLWNKYHKYFESDISAKSSVLGQIYSNAGITAENLTICIDMVDSFLSRRREKELASLLEQIWSENFGIAVTVKTTFHEPVKRKVTDELQELLDTPFADGSSSEDDDFNGIHEDDGFLPYEDNEEEEFLQEEAQRGLLVEKAAAKAEAAKPSENSDKTGADKEPAPAKSSVYEKAKYIRKKLPEDPDIFYGRPFEGEAGHIADIIGDDSEVVIRGKVIRNYDSHETRTGKLIETFAVTDFTDTILVKIFLNEEEKETVPKKIKAGSFVKLKGIASRDTYAKDVVISSVRGIKTIPDFTVRRKDDAPVKRVELHAHTQMSDMDGVVSADELVKTAFKWGHRGIAITDHGVVQSFPIANHALNWKDMDEGPEKERAKNFKIIYGCEGYLVDDEPDEITDSKGHVFKKREDGTYSDDDLKKMPMYHIILLCANDTGRINLYKLVSLSHLNYFARRPRIPKSLLRENREGLIIGSACEAGELFRAIVHEKPEEEIRRIADFYDYYEIQQIGNNAYMIDDNHFPEVNSEQDLKRINKQIVELADHDGKLCVATCDVHFLNPEDEVYRRIIMASKGFEDADRQAPLYLHTTEEMLDECRYLGKDKAYEVVVENPNKIFDMIERISPVRPDKCPPVIPDSDKTLREICENRAHAIYGPELPAPVSERLEHELESIIKNGFAVMYIIAQKLVWKSNEDGYLVGSRGSVGSSFVATMSGITEINPLPPHYYCKKCHYSDFDSDLVKSYIAKSGCDMPDMDCPVCGEKLVKEGHNIPFETFLGFYGDKEPDIDLNFSGEYQSKAHAYTEVIFGAGQTFRAGTIGTLADKTAFGLVKKYCETRNIEMRDAEKERIAAGCVGVRRTVGQHPGGIVVLPLGENIYSFTPVQHPPNDETSITTHFEYHSIDHNLLKLDILGHDDPTMIRMLEDLTGLDAKTIPMDDPKVISLFESTEALGVKPDDIDGVELGSLGLPELGTNFVMQMLKDTKPKCFSDMVKIAGLSHGTDVWLNNAQLYIQRGDCTLSTAICTRDDIMIYLISKGLEPGLAFKTMESVRKGKGLKPEMEEAMIAHEVPAWYIESCKKIKYMFPKAHACAYMMMAFRIAYFKIYYPLAYYAAYFSIRASNFDYAKMCLGRDNLIANMKENLHKKERSAKDEGEYDDMRSVLEMYSRGFEFMPIDIYRAKARHFQIIDGKLMPSLNCLAGLGDKAAEQIYDAAGRMKFISKQNFKSQCKVSDTIVNLMSDLGLLDGLPESDQISFADFFEGFGDM